MKWRRLARENPLARIKARERHVQAQTFPPISTHGAVASAFKNVPFRSIREPLHFECVNPVFFRACWIYLYIWPPTRNDWRDVEISVHLGKTRGLVCVTHKLSRRDFPGTTDLS